MFPGRTGRRVWPNCRSRCMKGPLQIMIIQCDLYSIHKRTQDNCPEERNEEACVWSPIV